MFLLEKQKKNINYAKKHNYRRTVENYKEKYI